MRARQCEKITTKRPVARRCVNTTYIGSGAPRGNIKKAQSVVNSTRQGSEVLQKWGARRAGESNRSAQKHCAYAHERHSEKAPRGPSTKCSKYHVGGVSGARRAGETKPKCNPCTRARLLFTPKPKVRHRGPTKSRICHADGLSEARRVGETDPKCNLIAPAHAGGQVEKTYVDTPRSIVNTTRMSLEQKLRVGATHPKCNPLTPAPLKTGGAREPFRAAAPSA